MLTETDTPLRQFVDWIEVDDVHAAHHVNLLRETERALVGGVELPAEDRSALAERLERWRYLWLSERAGRLTDKDRGLVDALDLAANRLAGRPARPARAPRRAVHPFDEFMGSASREGDAPGSMASDDARRWLDPAASLDELVDRAARATDDRFGAMGGNPRRRMLLYAPLYLSSFCVNQCAYCGFRFDQTIERKHLSVDEAVAEAQILRRRGFRHILLVAGDFPRLARAGYFVEIITRLRAMGICPAVEIAPQSLRSYGEMAAAGLCGVTLYQETYEEGLYRRYHPGGTKASFDWRLEGPERAAEAGVVRLGLGVLLGLADPRKDVLAMMRHARYLSERFPDRALAFSLPRIHEAPSDFCPPYKVDDDLFVRLFCVLRLAFPTANLVLSTREKSALRERLSKICITQLSAGSCTAPGGYGHEPTDGQFPVHDRRGVDEVVDRLERDGFRPVWTFDEFDRK